MSTQFHCQACGAAIEGEHICKGMSSVVTDMEIDSILATDARRDFMNRSGPTEFITTITPCTACCSSIQERSQVR